MNLNAVVFVFLLTLCKCAAQELSFLVECTTPSGQPGLCVEKCHCLLLRNATTIPKHRKCGSPSEENVCCESNQVQRAPCPQTTINLSGICVTPSGSKGQCVPFRACPVFDRTTFTPNHILSLKASVCDKKEQKVCCRTDEDLNQVCGIDGGTDFRIWGGTPTIENEFPWVVVLEYRNPAVLCGGSLMNSQFVLTAGHCVRDDLIRVRVGNNNNQQPLKFNVIGKRTHTNFKRIRTPNKMLLNDIALLKIEKAPYRESVRWLCLPPSTTNLPGLFVVVGSGLTDTGKPSELQLKATLPLASVSECKKLYGEGNNYDNVICAGGQPGIDSCQGDSGGPLMTRENATSQWHLYGIVSSGIIDCSVGKPALYTRVDKYLDWINENMRTMV